MTNPDGADDSATEIYIEGYNPQPIPAPIDFMNETFLHLAKQGQRSVNAEGKCVYRGRDGLRCAIGFWIEDRDYNASRMEGKAVFYDSIRYKIPQGFSLELATKLQGLHDLEENWASPAALWVGMQAVANWAQRDINPEIRKVIDENWKGASQ